MAKSGWICSVCGYVHPGATAPDLCPTCGATSDYFTPLATTVPVPASGSGTIEGWRCLNCDYLHAGSSPPTVCPVCGVGPEQFAAANKETTAVSPGAVVDQIVIVGGGIAGLSAAVAARRAAPAATVTLLSQEAELPYYRLNLTRYLAGEIAATDLPIHPSAWYIEERIAVLTGSEVTAIDRQARTITVRDGARYSYDRLILAMGAHPSVPPLAGMHRRNVVTLRTRRDADAILAQCNEALQCVVIGGGVLGLETAAALARRRVKVTLVEGFDWLLPRQLNPAAAAYLARAAGQLGIEVICGGRIKELDGDERVRSVLLESGETLAAELVIVAAGVRCNSYLARLAGLTVKGGVVVDHSLRTSDPAIFAAGDLAEHQGVLYGTWAPAQFQGTIAGGNAAGGDISFVGVPRSNSLKVLGVELFSIGQIHPEDASYQSVEDGTPTTYRLLVLRDCRLVGAILVGETSLAPQLKALIESQTCLPGLPDGGDAADVRRAMVQLAAGGAGELGQRR